MGMRNLIEIDGFPMRGAIRQIIDDDLNTIKTSNCGIVKFRGLNY